MSDPNATPQQGVPHPEIVDDKSIPENWIEVDVPSYDHDWADDYDNQYEGEGKGEHEARVRGCTAKSRPYRMYPDDLY